MWTCRACRGNQRLSVLAFCFSTEGTGAHRRRRRRSLKESLSFPSESRIKDFEITRSCILLILMRTRQSQS